MARLALLAFMLSLLTSCYYWIQVQDGFKFVQGYGYVVSVRRIDWTDFGQSRIGDDDEEYFLVFDTEQQARDYLAAVRRDPRGAVSLRMGRPVYCCSGYEWKDLYPRYAAAPAPPRQPPPPPIDPGPAIERVKPLPPTGVNPQ